MQSLLLRVLIAVVGASLVAFPRAADAAVHDLSFAEAEAETTKQSLVFFARGQDPALRALLEDVSSFSDNLIYVYVDCEAPSSAEKCAAASFTEANLPRVFVNSVEGGIESISGAPEKDAILNFLEFRSSPVAGERVVFAESDKHFNELLGKGRHVMVKYFQTWCSHCKRYKKHFELSSTLFGSSAPVEVLFVEVDCGQLEQACRDNGVSSYPTMKFYDANNEMAPTPVKARDHAELTTFLKEHAQPVVKVSCLLHGCCLSWLLPALAGWLAGLNNPPLFAAPIVHDAAPVPPPPPPPYTHARSHAPHDCTRAEKTKHCRRLCWKRPGRRTCRAWTM